MSLIIPPASDISFLTNKFHLEPSQITRCDKYFIRYWQASYVFSSFLACHRFMHEKIAYQPVFMESVDEKWLSMNPDKTVRCSFRRLKGKQAGYMLIARTPEKETQS